jgi:hypothetical protein
VCGDLFISAIMMNRRLTVLIFLRTPLPLYRDRGNAWILPDATDNYKNGMNIAEHIGEWTWLS